MDQIANLVIDLGIDAAEFKNEIPRIKNLLNGAASDAERSSARMQRFMERQTQAARQTTQAASSAATAASVHAQTVEKNAQAHERMAREVEKTRQRMEALSQKMREEQAQAMALAEAQDKAAAAFYRQIDSVKQASAGLQELQRIQQQIRQARNSGGIGQQDYLALISEVTAKTRVLTQAEEEATRQKVAFIRQLKEQAAVDAQSCYFREWYHATCCSRCAGSGGGEWCISWKRYRYGGESCRTDGAIGWPVGQRYHKSV